LSPHYFSLITLKTLISLNRWTITFKKMATCNCLP